MDRWSDDQYLRSNHNTNKKLVYTEIVMNEEQQTRLQRLKILSVLMDSKFEGPLGIRFGLDGIVGFVPVVGDIITTLVSFSILVTAAQMGATPSTLIRMAWNILFENLIDMIPIFGNFFDIWWQSNNLNITLLEEQLTHPRKVTITSRIFVLCLILGVFILLFLMMYLSWMMIQFFVHLLS
ncbi:MAG: DUF4112 domain-containing protein [Bacteriovoracaceae bacterium]